MNKSVNVIGAGLAGCEAAMMLSRAGINVRLYEMKPTKFSAAHSDANFAELVCSNSLKAERVENACGLLKEEMKLFGSLTMEAAGHTRVPAGGALAVDRKKFSAYVTDKIKEQKNIEIIREEVTDIKTGEYTIIATGPLTSEALAKNVADMTASAGLYFYDAAAPVVASGSIDMTKAFRAARYGRGDDDYINCPMTEEEYTCFYEALVNAGTAPLHEFEKVSVFEGCMPVEVMAKRGIQTLTFGPLKPVGLTDPRTGKDDSYAVVQLRQDNSEGTLYNMVGFQTNLKWGEQKRVFSMIPGLENAEFVRYGVMHRNTYINSPKLLNEHYEMKEHPEIFFAGQITGVEGYVESASSGIVAGINMARLLREKEMLPADRRTATGSLAAYIADPSIEKFQPMNANFGIMQGLDEKIRNKQERYGKIAERALEIIKNQICGGIV